MIIYLDADKKTCINITKNTPFILYSNEEDNEPYYNMIFLGDKFKNISRVYDEIVMFQRSVSIPKEDFDFLITQFKKLNLSLFESRVNSSVFLFNSQDDIFFSIINVEESYYFTYDNHYLLIEDNKIGGLFPISAEEINNQIKVKQTLNNM